MVARACFGDALRVRWRCVVRSLLLRARCESACECMSWGGSRATHGWAEGAPAASRHNGSGLRDSGCGLRGDRVLAACTVCECDI